MQQINYRSDFDFILRLYDAAGHELEFPTYDFKIVLRTEGSTQYVASYIGGVCTNLYNDGGKIHVVCDNHGLAAGVLRLSFEATESEAKFTDGNRHTVVPQKLDIMLTVSTAQKVSDADVRLILPTIKGEPFRYSDFTAEQIADLKRPATDAADEVLKAESERKTQFDTAQEERASAFTASETNRTNTFNVSEKTRQDTFEEQETTRRNNETTRQNNETDRVKRFNKMEGDFTNIENKVNVMVANSEAMIDDVANGKKAVAKAISGKGVPTKSYDSFAKMAANIERINGSGAIAKEFFKIEVDNNNPSSEVKRIGTSEFPDWLEAETQNIMAKDGQLNYLLDRTTSLKKRNGMSSVIDGTDGDIMICLPVFWWSRVDGADNVDRYTFSETKQTGSEWHKSPEIWVGATEMVIEERNGQKIARSCYNTTPEFRGGNGDASLDRDKIKGYLGKPRNGFPLHDMRIACQNKGSFSTGRYHGFSYLLYQKLNLMFMCIYGTRNWQTAFAGYDPATGEEYRNSEGFKYGGLGIGFPAFYNNWSKFNGGNAVVPANVGLELGCRSGVVEYRIRSFGMGFFNATIQVPVFLGIANIFGHIMPSVDGMTCEVSHEGSNSGKGKVGIYYDPSTFVEEGTVGASKVFDFTDGHIGYIDKTDKDLYPIGDHGSESTHYGDFTFHPQNDGIYSFVIGASQTEVYAYGHGLWALNAYNSPTSLIYNGTGGRLCFTPSESTTEQL